MSTTIEIDVTDFPEDNVYLPRFYDEMASANLPVTCADCSLTNGETPPEKQGNVYANFWRELTPAEQAQLDTIVATHDATPPDVTLDVSGTIGGQSVNAVGVIYTSAS